MDADVQKKQMIMLRQFFIKYSCQFFIFLVIFTVLLPSFSGTLEDIRNKLGVEKNTSQKKKKNQFEIRMVRPGNVKGWRTKTDDGRKTNLFGVEVTFKVNKKIDLIHVPYHYCYFFDKDKNLLDRRNAAFIFGKGKQKCVELEGDLYVKGKKSVKIIFAHPSTFLYKYAVCVIGNTQGVDAACYPRSTNYEDFDFDEKILVYKNRSDN